MLHQPEVDDRQHGRDRHGDLGDGQAGLDDVVRVRGSWRRRHDLRGRVDQRREGSPERRRSKVRGPGPSLREERGQ